MGQISTFLRNFFSDFEKCFIFTPKVLPELPELQKSITFYIQLYICLILPENVLLFPNNFTLGTKKDIELIFYGLKYIFTM